MFNGVEYIREICHKRGIAISQLERDLGFSNGYLNPKKLKKIPYDRAVLIADYLGLSANYIVTGQEAEKSPSKIGEGQHRIPDEETLKLLELLETREDIRYLAAASTRATPEHVKATAKMFDELYGRNQDK